MKRFPILPTLVTLGNLICGFLAIGYVLKAQAATPEGFGPAIVSAGWLIFAAMVFDILDGKIARLYAITSAFGRELDSLCDMVSFGVAPALIIKVLASHQRHLPNVAWATSIFFVMCVALRLARFNIETNEAEESHQHFNGLPSPAAAAFIAAMTILFFRLRGDDPQEFARLAKALEPVMNWTLFLMPVISAVLGALMISNIRYVHVMGRLTQGREPLPYLAALGILIIVVFLTHPFSLPVLIGGYIVTGIAGWLKELLTAHLPRKTADHIR